MKPKTDKQNNEISVDLSDTLRLKLLSENAGIRRIVLQAYNYKAKTWEIVDDMSFRAHDFPKFISAVEKLGKLVVLQ
jgi:hypothetical protein